MSWFSRQRDRTQRALDGVLQSSENAWNRFADNLARLARWLWEGLRRLFSWLLAITRPAGQVRRWLLILAGALGWSTLALNRHPPQWSDAEALELWKFTFQALWDQRWFGLVLMGFFYIFWRFIITRNPSTALDRYSWVGWLIVVAIGMSWGIQAAQALPSPVTFEFSRLVIEYPFHSLLARDVLRTVYLCALAFWMAHRLAAIYLDDIFELLRISTAERFINQAAFASQYDTIHIVEENVAEADRYLVPAVIGGPGTVDFGVEHAVVLEEVGGSVRVAGPQPAGRGTVQLRGFERIRRSIDLRSRRDKKILTVRTREGIPVTAEDLQYVFSVYRGPEIPVQPDPAVMDPAQPYPYDEQAVRRLTYRYATHWSAAASGQIRAILREFIAGQTLSEFLARTATPEFDLQFGREREIAAPDRRNQVSYPRPFLYQFFERAEISDFFRGVMSDFADRAREAGVAVEWVGVGTWIIPVDIGAERHRQAWLLTRENYQRSNSVALTQVSGMSRLEEIHWLITDIHVDKYQQLRNRVLNRAQMVAEMRVLYRNLLRQALELDGRGILTPEQVRTINTALNIL